MSTQNLGLISSKSYNNKDSTRQSWVYFEATLTHTWFTTLDSFWAEMSKSFALGKIMNLHNIVLNHLLP